MNRDQFIRHATRGLWGTRKRDAALELRGAIEDKIYRHQLCGLSAADAERAALRDLGGGQGELKSMRTHPDHLRRGVAAALLRHIIGQARQRGMTRLSLETGSGEAFEPALELYRRRGFESCGAFSDYVGSDFNQFMALRL